MPAVVDLEKCDVLSIEGERKAEEEAKDEDYYCYERAYGRFYRGILLPAGVQKEKIDSDLLAKWRERSE
jgi:HSP20 family molecular chaperone IbpA